MKIEIHVDRPVSLLLSVALIGGFFLWRQMQVEAVEPPVIAHAHGGTESPDPRVIFEGEQQVKRLRQETQLSERQEEILRYQIRSIEEQMEMFGVEHDPDMRDEFIRSVKELTQLLMDRQRAEAELQQSLQEIQEAQGRALATPLGILRVPIRLSWPVEPIYGISAHFQDSGYEKIFGFAHNAIDIPIEQNSTVLAPADGVVEEYVDNGTGYSWLTIRHDGFVTLYGHVTSALVKQGDRVWEGDPIATSGGLPGSKGAGRMTTGPHLHFEVITDEGHVDPEKYLPRSK